MLPDPKNDKKKNRTGTNGQFRYLSAEMLQKSRQMSEEQNMWKRQIERAEFRAYGTRPSGQKALDMQININATPAEQSNGQVRVHYCSDTPLYYEEAAYRVYGTPRADCKNDNNWVWLVQETR